jgi:hypothetical protein
MGFNPHSYPCYYYGGKMNKKILLINIDSSLKNIALEKIRIWYENKGYKVVQEKYEFLGTLFYNEDDYESVWVSCIFDWNRKKTLFAKDYHKDVKIGGSGIDLYNKLPDEIDSIRPKINYGFTTRGCIRKCEFCIVPKKEGMIHVVGDIYDTWDSKSKQLILLDNNILALPEHFMKITDQILKEDLSVDFNQGLDHRLLSDDIVKRLKKIKTPYYRFAFDNIGYKETVLKAIKLLKKYDIISSKCTWYVYTNGMDWESDIERLNILRGYNHRAYLMMDRKMKKEKKYIALRRWVNSFNFFAKMTFDEYIKINYPKLKIK